MLPAPPARPFLNRQITPPVLPDAAASDAVPVHPAAPAASNVPAERDDYVILVASFENRERAERLVEELTSAGFRAREMEVDLGPRGRWVQVIVGGYSSALEVERDLQRIRELPGYGGARLLERE
jgi:cell division septation protein DedD